MLFRILLLTLFATCPALAASKARIALYPVVGDTAPEIYESIKKTSPRVAPNATFAFTSPYFKTDSRTKKSSKACGYASFKTSTIFQITLPHLNVRKKPSPQLMQNWQSFVNYLLEHEQWHQKNWTACLKDYDAEALQLSAKDCDALDRKREKLFTSVKKKCVAKDEAFDFNFRKDVQKHPFVKAALKKN